MDRIKIIGGNKLNGEINVSGAKNATLPLLIASILTEDELILENTPHMADVELLKRILGNHGVDIMIKGKGKENNGSYGKTTHLLASIITDTTAPYELVSKMRASFWILGPLLARCGVAKVSLPGGCAIGTRPVDIYLDGLKKMGAEILIKDGYVEAECPNGLEGAEINFPLPSVGATHVIMMAASLASGKTIIENAAKEPEIIDLAECLNKMGAKIVGAGSDRIVIEAVDKLHGARHKILSDRIEAGTYAFAVAACGGEVNILNIDKEIIASPINILKEIGIKIEDVNGGIKVISNGNDLKNFDVKTAPYPGFPTDLQAQLMALATSIDGKSTIQENIFENRFMHVQELVRLGADIKLNGDMAIISGGAELNGAQVMATDLRASVSLVIAGLIAKGETIINRVYHLDRGFEDLEQKLSQCGANIERLVS